MLRECFAAAILLPAILVSISFAQGDQTPTPTPSPTGVNQPVLSQQPASASAYIRPDAKTRFNRFVIRAVGPFAIAGQVASAGISTWRNSPEEWGSHWEGFGRRVASGVGKNIIEQTAVYGLDEVLKVDSHYYRSRKKGVGARIRNALLSPVTARNRNGKRIIGVPRIAGIYGANIIAAETWYPDRYDWKDGMKSGTILLGIGAAFNLFKEFVWKK